MELYEIEIFIQAWKLCTTALLVVFSIYIIPILTHLAKLAWDNEIFVGGSMIALLSGFYWGLFLGGVHDLGFIYFILFLGASSGFIIQKVGVKG